LVLNSLDLIKAFEQFPELTGIIIGFVGKLGDNFHITVEGEDSHSVGLPEGVLFV
jgi:hypothetical protein